MKILTAQQIREWDQYTIVHEPIASIDLMERAAGKCFDWLNKQGYVDYPVVIFCGKGNNGGDGLVLARKFAELKCPVSVYILEPGHKGTVDFQTNLARLHQFLDGDIHYIQDESNFHKVPPDSIIIDALFGSGLTRPLDGTAAKLVDHINKSGCEIISIDIPSGMSVDQSSKDNAMIKASHTLSFQCYKPAFFLAENALNFGKIHLLDIGLHHDYLKTIEGGFELIDEIILKNLYKPRNQFSHKGNFGHALLIAGSYGKMGAAVLAAKACLRSGVGLLTCFIPRYGYEILQSSVPEAMVLTDDNAFHISAAGFEIQDYDSVGIGPGIGTVSETREFLKVIFSSFKKPMVIDADAINGLSLEEKLPTLPPRSVLTPHPKEFERLFGQCKNDFERIEKAIHNARLLNCLIILKGHHTFIATPGGKGYFNNTGNAGMATPGSGDTLTGIITGLLAQHYTSEQAAILGVYLHGLAGDLASEKLSQEAMVAGDITENLGQAFLSIIRKI